MNAFSHDVQRPQALAPRPACTCRAGAPACRACRPYLSAQARSHVEAHERGGGTCTGCGTALPPARSPKRHPTCPACRLQARQAYDRAYIPRLTPEEATLIRRMRRAGATIRTIADTLGRAKKTVAVFLARAQGDTP